MKKSYKITPTLQQIKLANAIKNYAKTGIRISKKELLKSIDYTEATAHGNANKILKSKGLKIALENEGISLANSDNVVKSILNSPIVYEMVTPDNQLRAADYIAKRLGGFQDNGGNKTLNINIFNPEQAKQIAERILKENK